MSNRRDRANERDGRGYSGFAQRGQSTEERMREDDSARRFPGRSPDSEYQLSDEPPRGDPREGYYGSGGSYGYGGSFEHDGRQGYQRRAEEGGWTRGGNEQFYEYTGGFGRDTSGYARHGLGHPGREEHRIGWPAAPGRGYINEDSNRPTGRSRDNEDARRGYSQESGYIQSGGSRVGPAGDEPRVRGGFERQSYGSGYGSSRQHADGQGHEGGGTRGSRPGARPDRGPYYGRTPQGYTRSDDRIREDVCDRLSHGHIDPTDLSVRVAQGVVVLEGFVEERHEKFHAEEIAESVLGVRDVENRLRLKRSREDARGDEPPRTPRLPNGDTRSSS
ncbi:MAG: BON domain-containing protein [Polyangiales bacterium]